MKHADFHISTKPVSIELECPYCEFEISFSWESIDVPEYWGDDWGEVICPYCEKAIQLGDYEYD